MSTSSDGEEVEVVLVSCDVTTHVLLAVNGPRSPFFGLFETKGFGPVLASEGIKARIGVTVVHKNSDRGVGHELLVERQEVLFGHVVGESITVVSREDNGILVNMHGLFHKRIIQPNKRGGNSTTRVVVETTLKIL